MRKSKKLDGDIRIVEMEYNPGCDTCSETYTHQAGYQCGFCGHVGADLTADICARCTYPLDPEFFDEVRGFADLLRKE